MYKNCPLQCFVVAISERVFATIFFVLFTEKSIAKWKFLILSCIDCFTREPEITFRIEVITNDLDKFFIVAKDGKFQTSHLLYGSLEPRLFLCVSSQISRLKFDNLNDFFDWNTVITVLPIVICFFSDVVLLRCAVPGLIIQ